MHLLKVRCCNISNHILNLHERNVAPKKRKSKALPQEPEASSSKSSSEFLQEKEEEAIKEATFSSPQADDDASADGEEEGSTNPNQAAFNPETGEINWDCPCLGGMAHGPCGPQFREAFSCFVFSEEEPKGINCVEKFKGMQDCFRAHPEVYGEGECKIQSIPRIESKLTLFQS